MVNEASQAAMHHDMFTLYGIINRHTPKHRNKRIQLRNMQGHIATPEESRQILTDFVQQTWAGPTTLDLQFAEPPGVPFTIGDLIAELRRIPITKAVAAPFIPGLVWKELAQFIGPIIHAQLTEWWSTSRPFIPQCWKDGWLCLLAKPLKPPSCPQNLRPIALQEPIGKAIVGLPTKIALSQSLSNLIYWPVMAYLPGRSGLDCILISQHCKAVRDLLQAQQGGPHLRARAISRYKLCGGVQLFLDLSRAFDMVCRRKLFQKLTTLGISEQIAHLLGSWHECTQYHVSHELGSQPIMIGRGVRQGCKGAPFLFNCFVVLFLRDLANHLPVDWIRANITIYADDFHVCSQYRSAQELEYTLLAFRLLFQTLTSLDMVVNPSKSVALLAMTGTAFRKHRQQHVVKTQDGVFLRLRADGMDDILIPLKT